LPILIFAGGLLAAATVRPGLRPSTRARPVLLSAFNRFALICAPLAIARSSTVLVLRKRLVSVDS
jgi:hypothetical protein